MLERRRLPSRLLPPPPPSPTLPSSPSLSTTSPAQSSPPHPHITPKIPHSPSTTRHSRLHTSCKQTLTPSPITLHSSYNNLEIGSIKLTSQELSQENHTSRFNCSEYEAVLRRGNTLIVCVTTSQPLISSYAISLTFISAYNSSDRFGQFQAQGKPPGSQELWFSITLPVNFPVGKFHTHVHLSINGGREVATLFHHKPVAVLFNPWNPDDDSFQEDQEVIENSLLAEVGVIWRGTSRQPSPIMWEYGQYAPKCLDAALHLLHGLGVAERRTAAAVSKNIVAKVNSRDGTGVMVEGYSRSHTGGMHPCRWNGSPAILQRFYRSRTPVRYGQCWVLAGLAITLLRSLGLVCRPVTCYEAAHLCTKLGQVDFCFTPQGELLSDATQDQLWIYHVWIEVWMRRDDLPTGHDGWQALDPTSQHRQGGTRCIGPVSLPSVKEERVYGEKGRRGGGGGGGRGAGGGGRGNGNGEECLHSEVSADVRFLRVLKSFTSITNRVLSVALVRHDQVGRSLLAGNGSDLSPINVTSNYKEVGPHDRATFTHYPAPSRDCKIDITTNDAAKLGKKISLTVAISNQGLHLRTLDGKVGGHIVRYTGVAIREFMSMQFTGVVAPGQSASVNIPIEAKQYLKLLADQCMLRFFVAVKARETGQLFLKIHHYQLQLPRLDVRCDGCTVTVGKVVRVKVTFRNPLSCSLSHLLFLLQAQGLCPQKEVTYHRMVLPGQEAKVEVPVRAQTEGTYHILASLHCDQLTDIRGWTQVTAVTST